MCIIELVDYNLTYSQDKKAEQKSSTRRRRAPKKKEAASAEPAPTTPEAAE
jgi:hypothetical protein